MSQPLLRLIVIDEATLQITEQSAFYENEATIDLALRWEAAIEEAIGSLRTFPERGPRVIDTEGFPVNMRKLHIDGFPKHLIFYQYSPGDRIVWIVSVLHGSRDIDLFLQLNARGWLET